MSDMADVDVAAQVLWDKSHDMGWHAAADGFKAPYRRDARDILAALSAAGFGPVQAAREVTEAEWAEVSDLSYDMDFGDPCPVVVYKTYTEAELRAARAEAWDEAWNQAIWWNKDLRYVAQTNPYRTEASS